ncbi:MAG: sensor histidine kinase [Sulfurisoma sp.]|nr:sensor histidine kinase [Sulfurisoma sp.]
MFRWILLLCWPAVALAGGLPVAGLALLADADGSETIASVAAPEAAARFRPLDEQLNAGYTRTVHWLRFTVQPPAPGEWWLEVQPPFLDDIRLYEALPVAPGAQPAFRERRGGDHQPFALSEVPYRAFVARLDLPDTRPRTFYLRLQTTSASMAFPKLWRPLEFQQAAATEYALLGGFYGLMATVFLLNLINWVWLRDSLYGYFSLHVLALTLLYIGVNGFASQFLFPDTPAVADPWLGFFLFASISAGAPFYRRILRVGRDRTGWFLFFRVQLVLPLLLMGSLFTGHYTEAARVLMGMTLLVIPLYLWLAYDLWRQGKRDGLFLLAAGGIVAFGTLPLVATLLGLYPGDQWLLHSRQITQLANILAVQLAVIAYMRDSETARFAAEARADLAESRAEAESAAQREHRQFVAMLTHELRTPLSVIDGAVQSLEYLHQPENEEVRLRHRRIRRSVGRINGLVKQFLAKDRVDDARLTVRPVPLDGVALARLAVESCVEGAVERVDLDAPAALPCRGDAALVQVALVNLLDNALKYSPPASPVGFQVEAMERQGRAGVAWTVADRGAGIASASWDEVFGKYVRGEDHDHVSGAGLGLYLVRRIAELHGGGVEILEREGWSAVLRFWLPLEGTPG